MKRLLLLGRPGCHLCDEFHEALLAAHPELAPVLQKACVDERPDWRAGYGRRIPVLLDDEGHLLMEGRYDPERALAII